MSRSAALLILFLVGIAGAGGVVYFTDVLPRARAQQQIKSSSQKAIRSAIVRELADASRNVSLDTLSPKELELRALLIAGDGLDELRSAIESSDPSALKYLRLEFLASIPDYQTAIIPVVRKSLLDELLFRFTDTDWRNWPQSYVLLNGGPTRAREFVTNVLVINRDLGVFLETAALLFHGLYRATEIGMPYDVRAGVRSIVENAENLVPGKPDPSVSARLMLSSIIVLEPNFVELFERERCRLVDNYITTNVKEVENQVRLIASVSSGSCSPNMFLDIAGVLSRVTTEASVRYRQALLDQELETRTLDGFAQRDQRVREELASLYATTSEELLKENDLNRARKYLGESIGLSGGVMESANLNELFALVSKKRASLSGKNTAPKRYTVTESDVEGEDNGPSISFLSVFLLCIGAAIAGVIYVRNVARKRAAPVERGKSISDKQDQTWTPVGETNHPDLPRPEIRVIKEFPKAANMRRR